MGARFVRAPGAARVAAAVVVVAVVALAVAGLGPAPGAGPAAAAPIGAAAPTQEAPGPALTVTPSTGLEVGDTVTVTGTGWPRQAPFIPPYLVGCSAEALAAPADLTLLTQVCGGPVPSVAVADDGTFTVEVRVATPGWQAVAMWMTGLGAGGQAVSVGAAAPIEVAPVATPAIAGALDADVVVAGTAAVARGWALPVPGEGVLGTRACTALPADPADPVAVDAACGPAATGSAVTQFRDGTYSALREPAPGDVALWVGGTLDGQPVGLAFPVTVVPRPVLVPLAARLVEGDAGTVTAEVPFVLSHPAPAPIRVGWATFDAPTLPWAARSGADYVLADGVVDIPAGATAGTATVEVVGDTVAEGEEMVLVGVRAVPQWVDVGGFGGIGGVVVDDDD